jgi:hypothetical protein
MRHWIYPIIAFLFNYILFNSFHWGEYGGALVAIVTVLIIAIVSLFLTFLHYWLRKRRRNVKWLRIAGVVSVVFVSYYLFPTHNSPVSIIKKMAVVAENYQDITISDYFLDNRYENYERIVAAKKKFKTELADTAFSVNIANFYDYKRLYKTYGIGFFNGHPIATNDSLKIETVSDSLFKFTDYLKDDTISFTGNSRLMNVTKERTDSFIEFGTGHFKDTTIKEVEIEQVLKLETPDETLWSYKIFYWLL